MGKIPHTLSHTNLLISPSFSTTQYQKNYLERPQSIETRNKKRKKTEQEVDIKDGGLEDYPPPMAPRKNQE